MKAICIKSDDQYGFEQGKEFEYEVSDNGNNYRITISLEKYWFTNIGKYDFTKYFKPID